MEQIFEQWRLRTAASGKRFVFTTLPEDPDEAYRHLMTLVPTTGLDRDAARRAKPKAIDKVALTDTIAREGFTYQPHDKAAPVTGFSVSVHPDHGGVSTVVPLSEITPSHIAGHRRQADDLYQHGYRGRKIHQGGWLDGTEDKVYLDTSHVEPDEETTRDLGIHHRQLAYYDLGRKQSVYFDPRRDPDMQPDVHPEKHQDAIKKYARVQQEHGQITPDKYWDYHHEYGPVPGEKESRLHGPRGGEYGLPLPVAPPSRYREFLQEHGRGPNWH